MNDATYKELEEKITSARRCKKIITAIKQAIIMLPDNRQPVSKCFAIIEEECNFTPGERQQLIEFLTTISDKLQEVYDKL